MKALFKRIAAMAIMASGLGGCAVYGPPPDTYYASPPVYGYAQPVPAYPAYPAYYSPAPVYVEPAPVTFGLNFGYWGGGRGWHHRH
jgi:hypothetical protein